MISSVAMLVLIKFLHNFYGRVGNDNWSAAQLLAGILRIRDDDFRVLFSDGGKLSMSELNCILSYTASSHSQFLIFYIFNFVVLYFKYDFT